MNEIKKYMDERNLLSKKIKKLLVEYTEKYRVTLNVNIEPIFEMSVEAAVDYNIEIILGL